MNIIKPVLREAFPTDFDRSSEASLQRSAVAITKLQRFVTAEPLGIDAIRTMPQIGHLTMGATYPRMRVVGVENLARFVEGGRVPDMAMEQGFDDGGKVVVKPYLRDGRVLMAVHTSAQDTTGTLHAGFPYVEGADFGINGTCFVKDNREVSNGPFYDSANEGLRQMVEPTQAVIRHVLAAIQ